MKQLSKIESIDFDVNIEKYQRNEDKTIINYEKINIENDDDTKVQEQIKKDKKSMEEFEKK